MLPFIFVAGVQPKTKRVNDNPRRCPLCGLHQAYYERVDHYFSLFFIPVWRVKKGESYLMCDRCEKKVTAMETHPRDPSMQNLGVCRKCGQAIDSQFRFCPQCGTKTNS